MSADREYPNVPVHTETFVHPHVPSFTQDLRRIALYCKANVNRMESYLERTPFELRADWLMIEIGDYKGRIYPERSSERWPFLDCGIVVPIRYGNMEAGYYLFQYETEDYAIFAGRELWGYPKTFGDVSLDVRPSEITGRVIKSGKEIVRIDSRRGVSTEELNSFEVGPILNIHTVPRPDGPGIFSQRVIKRDTSFGIKQKHKERIRADVVLRDVRLNHLSELGPLEVMKAVYEISDVTFDSKWGWGEVIETLV